MAALKQGQPWRNTKAAEKYLSEELDKALSECLGIIRKPQIGFKLYVSDVRQYRKGHIILINGEWYKIKAITPDLEMG